jgi:hypothetical protein
MKAKYKNRLLKLADLLEADAKNKKGITFNLNVVAEKRVDYEWSSKGYHTHHFKLHDTPTLSCGTAACAVGLAMLSGAFKRQGFTYYYDPDYGLLPQYGLYCGFGSADAEFFGLSEIEHIFLFMPGSYNNNNDGLGAKAEREVAKRIRQFVADKVSPP